MEKDNLDHVTVLTLYVWQYRYKVDMQRWQKGNEIHLSCCRYFGRTLAVLRVPAHRLRNFLLMVAMHDYYYCILTGASPLQHKDKVPAEGAAH